MSVVHVVAAVIVADDKKILLAKRPDHVHKGGLWEFPGGKLEDGESPSQALSRELEEELAISVLEATPLLKIQHDYPEKSVLLDVWQVTKFSGCAKGNEGQPIVWVKADELKEYQFPEANQPIIDELLKRHNQ
ncbi:MAG: 8-oxo-dGTP diphosphatase MutT [Porticoccaceae bacterium]|nr:MAG: 8-oxo-dGTP diphosphatase MutT [Porticoccaceae bacterium]